MPDNVVMVFAYSAFKIDWKLSQYVDSSPYKSNLLAIRDDQITNPMAAFPLRKGFEHRARLSNAVASMQIALHVIYDDFGKKCYGKWNAMKDDCDTTLYFSLFLIGFKSSQAFSWLMGHLSWSSWSRKAWGG